MAAQQRAAALLADALPNSGAGSYYSWQVPNRPVTIQLRHSLMESIADQVREAFQSVPRRGAETGGIVLGSRVLKSGNAVIIGESIERIECEHRSGPSFTLSDNDRERLAAQVRRLKAEGLVVVGFYRSHTGPGDTTPGEDDRVLLDQLSPGAAAAFILLHPRSVARIEGSLHFWHEGKPLCDTGSAPFPFGADLVRAAAPLRVAEPPVAPEAIPAPATTAPVTNWTYRNWVALALLALAVAIAAFFAVRIWTAPEPPAVELTAARDQNRLVVRWNPTVPPLADVQTAALTIQDGDRRTQYSLDRAQLLGGAVSYTPLTGHVSFLIEARAKDRPARGTLTVLDPSR